MGKTVEQLLEEQNELLRERNRIERAVLDKMPEKKNSWVCGSWPRCYHGTIIGGVFGCYGSR